MLPQSPPSKSGHAGYAVGYAIERSVRSSSLLMLISCAISPMEKILSGLGQTPRSKSTPS